MNRPLLLCSFGIGLVVLSAGVYPRKSRPATPGELVAREPTLVYQSPAPVAGKTPVGSLNRFVLENRGGQPVRVLSVRSGCGCTTPRVEPTLIRPGETCRVEVEAKVPHLGEKIVPITLVTDSPKAQYVDLQLRLLGSHQPPFLLTVEGDLHFLDKLDRTSTREITVRTVEKEPSARAPRVFSDLSFLKIDLVSVDDEPYVVPGTTLRTHIYRVSITHEPPPGTVNGSVTAVSPWEPSHILSVPVFARNSRQLRVTPAHIVIEREPSNPNTDGDANMFLVTLDDPSWKDDLVVEQGKGSPLIIERREIPRAERLVAYSVRLAPGRNPVDGDHRISVRSARIPDPAFVSVSVRAQGKRP